VDSRRPLGRGAPASSTWASFAPPLRVIAISTGGPPRSGHRGPGQSSPAGAPFSVPEPLSSLAAVPSPLAGPDPTRLGESSLLPLPPSPRRPRTGRPRATARRRRRSGGKSECPGQFERRSHRLHHVPEAVLVRCLSECRDASAQSRGCEDRTPKIEHRSHAYDGELNLESESSSPGAPACPNANPGRIPEGIAGSDEDSRGGSGM